MNCTIYVYTASSKSLSKTCCKEFNGKIKINIVANIAVTMMCYLFTDVTTLLEKSTYKYGKYTFDVAEYYPDVGVCIPDSLCVFPSKIGTTNGK